MKYLEGTFTLPAGPPNVTQEEWDAIWKEPTVTTMKVLCVHCELPIDLTPSEGGCVCLLEQEAFDY